MNIIPFPCKASLLNHFREHLTQGIGWLQSIDESINILKIYEKCSNDIIPCCVAVDATAIYNDFIHKRSGTMIYQVQPLSYLFQDFVIHFSLGEKKNESLRINIGKICEVSGKSNFDPVFISSDDDS